MKHKLINFIKDNYHHDTIITCFTHDIDVINDITPTTKNTFIILSEVFLYSWKEPTNGEFPLSDTITILHNVISSYKKYNFFILCESVFVDRELSQLPTLHNASFISTNEFIFSEHSAYKNKVIPTIVKDFTSQKHILLLSNILRTCKLGAMLFIFKHNLQEHCRMSRGRSSSDIDANSQRVISWLNHDDPLRNTLIECSNDLKKFQFMYEKIANGFYPDGFLERHEIGREHSSHAWNFIKKLTNHYKSTFIEFVLETSAEEPILTMSEKFVNHIFGCSFPIYVAPYGTVQHIRDMGFDVFDDIINHDYDNELNPTLRIKKMVEMNYELLSNNVISKDKWVKNRHRFITNVNHYKHTLYSTEYTRITSELLTAVRG